MTHNRRNDKEITARRLEAERLAVKAREKENLDRQQQALRRQKEFRDKTQIWNEQILPRWNELFQGSDSHVGLGWSGFIGGAGASAKVRDLCHKGIPPNIRGKVWPLMIKNDLKIDGEVFEHLNRKVIQIYGVNLSANKPQHPEDRAHHATCPVYRDSFLGLFDEDHPLYPRDGSPAPKTLGKLSGGKTFLRPGPGARGGTVHGGNATDNTDSDPAPQRSYSIIKRAQSLSSLASLVTSGDRETVFSVRKSPLRGAPTSVPEETAADTVEQQQAPCMDVTDEPWFQNERNGSLDQSAFEYVQKQLFAGTDMAETLTARHNSTLQPTAGADLSALKTAAEAAASVTEEAPKEETSPIPRKIAQSGLSVSVTSPTRAPISHTPFNGTTTPPKELPISLGSRPHTPNSQAASSPVNAGGGSAAYMNSPSLRKFRSKSEENVLSRPSEHHVSDVLHVDTGISSAHSGAQAHSPSGAGAGASVTEGVSTSGRLCLSASGRSPRVEALIDTIRKQDAHFFSSSSDEDGADSEDDVIPHIIPLDIQQVVPIDDRDRLLSGDGDPIDDRVLSGDGDDCDSDMHSELQGLDLLSSPGSVRSAQSALSLRSKRADATAARSRGDDETGDDGGDLAASALGSARLQPSSPVRIDRAPSLTASTPPSRATPLWLSTGSSHNLLYTPEGGSEAPTPPARQRHSEEYLAQAGLLEGYAADTSGLDSGRGGRASTPTGHNNSSQRGSLLFPGGAQGFHADGHTSPMMHRSRAPSAGVQHSPQQSYSLSGSHSHSALRTPSGASRTASTGRDTRSYSRQSMEEILHNALVERDTEGTVLLPSQSRFSFQASSTSLRLGSIDGSAVLLSDEPITIRDDNYFPSPPTSPLPLPAKPASAVRGATTGSVGGKAAAVTPNGVDSTAASAADADLSSPNTLAQMQERAAAEAQARAEAERAIEEHNQLLVNSMSLIEWDLPRTYPTLGFFHDGGPMHTGLERVLMCYVCYRPDVGYVQGMSYLVATLLLYMDEFEAFKCMANLLGRRLNMDFYKLQKEAIEAYVNCFNFFFSKMLPLLYEHFRMEGVTSEMFLMDWMMSLFTKTLPLEIAAHIWDVYLYEGEMYLMCVALGILKLYAAKLSTFTVEKVSPFLLHLPEDMRPEDLFNCISQIRISRKRYDRIRLLMAVQAYGSMEAYEKANKAPAPIHIPTPTSPLGGSNALHRSGSANNVHVVSSKRTPVNSPPSTAENGVTQPDFWERRRQFRKSVLGSLLSRWTGNKDGDEHDGNAENTTRRANTTVGGQRNGAGNKPRSNSMLFRRASTSAVPK